MTRFLALLLFSCTVGCGGSKPSSTPGDPQTPPSETPAVKLSTDEVVRAISEYFSLPSIRFSNVQVENVSEPVAAPKEAVRGWGDVWVYSVTMNCNNIVGDRQQNKNWLVLMSKENGRATVKDYYHNLERVQQSPLGKEWFVQKGFPEPAIVHND